jgi:spermidine synthase
VKVVRTRRGLRLVEGDVVLSELLAQPGPTHTLFDVLAACVAALAPGPRVALLGFAAGGIIAPLRAMGFRDAIEAVDLDPTGERLFRELSGSWAMDVRVARMDAAEWLAREGPPFDLIVEDLSVPGPLGTVKPAATFGPLPGLVRGRLRPSGVAVTNLLPLPGERWGPMVVGVAKPHARAAVLDLDEYENRFVLAGADLPEAPELSRRVRASLDSIGSVQARRIRVRTLLRE